MLRCDNIKKYFPVERGYARTSRQVLRAVDGVSLEVRRGETFGLVGESGSGKTTLGKIILGILRPDSGFVSLETARIQAIFQDPQNSLDPRMKVLDILTEGLLLRKESKKAAISKVPGILDLVQLPQEAVKKYPHQFSGGERQRIAIARALITEPEFIVCDEPVSSLDITIQMKLLKLLKDIQKKFSITYFFISHDLRVVKFMSDRIAVMRSGKIVEEGAVRDIYHAPAHLYTRRLIASILNTYPNG